MRIFGRSKKEKKVELALWTEETKRSFDVFSALAKALLLFLLVDGAIGGFLSAYKAEYNSGFCMLVIFLFSLLMCLVYETRKKWLINVVNVVVLFLYFYVAIVNYWAINSGYYAIINKMYEVARDYLGILNGTEYTLMFEEEYLAITLFAVFIGMVGCILLNIELQSKARLWKIVLLTFTPYLIPLYFEQMPSTLHMMFLLSGYTTVAVLHSGNVREYLTKQIRYVLPVVTLIVFILLRMIMLVMPQETYGLLIPDNPVKVATQKNMTAYAQFGLMALLQHDTAGGGVSGGKLSNSSAVLPDYETDLIVRYTPYSLQSVYLKAYTGKDYEGNKWSEASVLPPQDAKLVQTMQARALLYNATPEVQGRGIMEIENVGASKKYEYLPYYTDEHATEEVEGVKRYTYYPSGGPVELPAQEVDQDYLKVPGSCFPAVKKVCEEAGFEGTPQEIANQVIQYFQDNYSYTLRPGSNYRRTDYITHFLVESKRGYCEHFASAGVMLLRYMGIPARYAEGYAFSYYDIIQNGILVEDADYDDYYSGFASMDKTGLIELEIPDSSAHAWVEIYIEGRGWIVVDPTPASTESETTSFWDAFRITERDASPIDLGENTVGVYLERAIGGATYLMVLVLIVILIILLVGQVLRIQKEKRQPKREQVKLSYQKLKRYMEKKDRNFANRKTIGDQLTYLREVYQVDITKEQEEALYLTFFGQEEATDYEKILKMVNRLRKKLKLLWKVRP